LCALVLLLAAPAFGAEKLAELTEKLRSAKDFRVRTQAALALGVSADAGAVVPLCGGLNDDNRTVRAASAAALGKLRLGGKACIQRRLATESHPAVKSMLTKVLARLDDEPPGIGPDTKYYVAIGATTNKTQGSDADVDRMVRRHLQRELTRERSLALAPPNESTEAAEKLLGQHKGVKPIFIWPKILAESEGGALRLQFSFTLFSYPDKAFKGSMSKSARVSGGRGDSLDDLEQLMQTLAPAIVQKFLSNVDRLQ
jgi:hypothetical protein